MKPPQTGTLKTMPKIQNFWVLSKSGIPLFFIGEKDSISQLLISGFFAAIQMLIDRVEHSQLNKIELEDNTFFYYMKGPIISVIEAKSKDELESQVYQIISRRLGQAFLELFPDEETIIVQDENASTKYQAFLPVYERITSEIEQMLLQSHREFLSKYFVEAASDEHILGVVVIDLEKDEILSSDIPPDCSVKDFESFGSMLFTFLQRLGKELKTGQINEILLRGQKYWLGGFRKGLLAVFMLFDIEYFGKVLPEFVNTPLKRVE